MASTPSKAAPATSGPNLTQRDITLFLHAFESNKNDFVVDYALLAEKASLANANSAKASWHGLKKKLDKAGSGGGAKDGAGDAGDAQEAGKKGKGKGKKAKAETEDAEPVTGKKRKVAPKDAGEEAEEAEPKAKKGRKGKKGAADEEGVNSEAEE